MEMNNKTISVTLIRKKGYCVIDITPDTGNSVRITSTDIAADELSVVFFAFVGMCRQFNIPKKTIIELIESQYDDEGIQMGRRKEDELMELMYHEDGEIN